EGAGCTGAGTTPIGGGVPSFQKWLGATPRRVVDFGATSSWPYFVSEASWAVTCLAQANLGVKMTCALPLVSSDRTTTVALVASGAYDTYFTQVGTTLVQNGFYDAILRLGWEFNLGNAWGAKQDPTNWVAAFKHVATVFRAVPGNRFRFDWNMSLGQQQIKA